MSLDVYLINEDGEEIYWRNITHNVAPMARAAGLYYPLWRPREIGITHAWQLVPELNIGLERMEQHETYLRQFFTPSNGWGSYGTLLDFTMDYLAHCKVHPKAKIEISR